MIVDSSALVAVILGEPEADRLLAGMLAAPHVRVAATTRVEASMVLRSRLGAEGILRLTGLLAHVGATGVDFSDEHAARAVQAHGVYGRGSGHPARLDFGDCLVYGVASVEDEPLLSKGDDFTRTDLRPALST